MVSCDICIENYVSKSYLKIIWKSCLKIITLGDNCVQKELEAAEKRVKELQDDLAAVQFTPHSKHGKLLMAKCRTLQEENSEIGREASEGKVSSVIAMKFLLLTQLFFARQEYHVTHN